jgi:hypothetical protein
VTVEPEGTPRRSRIPDFQSIEEEAEWWDTHDITDYLDELRPVELRVAPDFKSTFRLTVRIDLEDWRSLEWLAKEQGVEPAELAARFLAERVRQEQGAGVGAT